MPNPKKFHNDPKKFDNVGEKIELCGAALAGACLFYDLTPGGSHDAGEKFREFIDLILYCNEKKLYSTRDASLRKIRDKYIF